MLVPTLLPLKRRQPDNVCLSLCVSKILNRFISLSRFSTFDLSPLDPLPLWPQLSLQNILTHTCTSRVHDNIIFIAERMIMMSSCSLVYSIWPFDLWSFTSWLKHTCTVYSGSFVANRPGFPKYCSSHFTAVCTLTNSQVIVPSPDPTLSQGKAVWWTKWNFFG